MVQFCDDPKNISTKSSYPPKIFIFLKTPKNIEIKNFEPQKMTRANIRVPPWGYVMLLNCLAISTENMVDTEKLRFIFSVHPDSLRTIPDITYTFC